MTLVVAGMDVTQQIAATKRMALARFYSRYVPSLEAAQAWGGDVARIERLCTWAVLMENRGDFARSMLSLPQGIWRADCHKAGWVRVGHAGLRKARAA